MIGQMGRGLVLLASCAIFGCDHETVSGSGSRLTQPLVISLEVSFPAGIGRLHAVVNGSRSVKINDGTLLVDNNGEPGNVSNSGTGEVNVGVEGSIGEVTSIGPVKLRNNAHATDVVTAGALTLQSGASVTGATVTQATLTPTTATTFSINFPSSVGAAISVEPNQSRTLQPGNYGEVSVKPNAKLFLKAGQYTFRTLDIQADAKLFVKNGALVQTRDRFMFKGAVWADAGGPPYSPPVWSVVHAGIEEVHIDSAFQGSLIAPKTKVTLASKEHTGWFYAKDIEVQSHAKVTALAGTTVCIPSQPCETIPAPQRSVLEPLPQPIPAVPPAEVGAIPWQFDVSPSGEAVYSIAIESPPGPGSVEPHLSLTYVSGSGNGPVGLGWSVGGLSMIARCSKTSASDEFAEPIRDVSTDRLCLDGQFMLWDEDSQAYRTEMDTMRRIVPVGAAAEPDGFTVYSKDGLIQEYGGAGARDQHEGVTRIWALREQRDRVGNLLQVSYRRGCPTGDCPDAPLVLDRIDYGGHKDGTWPHDRSLQFSYESQPRSDVLESFQRGSLRKTTVRLQRIAAHVDSGEAWSYEIAYESASRLTRVESVARCALDACLPATTFVYRDRLPIGAGDAAGEVAPPQYFGNGIESSSKGRTLVLDANGDGFDDLLFPGIGVYRLSLSRGRGESQATPIFDTPVDTQLGIGFETVQTPIHCLSESNIIDYDGDGADDIVDECRGRIISLSGGQFGVNYDAEFDVNPEDERVFVAELTGDGHPDLIHCKVDSFANSLPVFHYELHAGRGPGGGFETVPELLPGFGPSCLHIPLQIDVDGDGERNLVQRSTDPYLLYAVGQDPNYDVEWQALVRLENAEWAWTGIDVMIPEIPVEVLGEFDDVEYEDYFLPEGSPVICYITHICEIEGTVGAYAAEWQMKILDANGDGLQDILTYRGDNDAAHRMELRLNTGAGFGLPEPASADPSLPFVSRFAFFRSTTFDFDNDGRQDLLIPTGKSLDGDQIQWYWLRFKGVGEGFEAEAIGGPKLYDGSAPMLADVDADGSTDVLALNASGDFQVSYGRAAENNLLVTTRDGLGRGVLISYDDVGTRSGAPLRTYYETACDPSVSKNVQCLRRVAQLVSQYQEVVYFDQPQPGAEVIVDALHVFRYGGARVGLHQRGWLGFEEVEHGIEHRQSGLELFRVEKSTLDNGAFLQQVPGSPVRNLYPFAGMVVGSEVSYPRLSRVVVSDSHDREILLSDAGLPFVNLASSTRTEFKSLTSGQRAYISKVEESFAKDSYGNLLRHERLVRGATQEEVERTITVNTHEPTASQIDDWLVGLPRATEVTSTTQEATSRRSSTYDYDALGQLEETTREPDDSYYRVTKTFKRNPKSGQIEDIVETDTNGRALRQSTQYDARGHFVEARIDAKGFEWREVRDRATGLVLVASDPNSIFARTGYDGLGREVVREVAGQQHTIVRSPLPFQGPGRMRIVVDQPELEHSETTLDAYGRVIETTTRGLLGQSYVQVTKFDGAGRPVAIALPHSAGDTSPLFGVREYDDLGRVTYQARASWMETTTQYATVLEQGTALGLSARALREASEIVSTTDEAGFVLTQVLGVRGSPVASVDGGGEVTEFYYGPFGDPVGSVDAEGNVTTVVPDRYGRPETRVDPDGGEHKFTYYASGELRTHTDAESAVRTYSYDSLGRIDLVVDADGTTNRWTYDVGENGIGRLSTTARRGEAEMAFEYEPRPSSGHNRGLLKRVTQRIASETHALQLIYDQYGRLSELLYPSIGSEPFVVGHVYDNAGNVVRIDDSQGSPLWQLEAADLGYRVGAERFGNGVGTITTYVSGLERVDSVTTKLADNAVQVLRNVYQGDGALRISLDGLHSEHNRHFTYDEMKRLRLVREVESLSGGDYEVGDVIAETTYDALGNIRSKTGVGEYDYEPRLSGGPHSVQRAGDNTYAYDANGRQSLRTGPDVKGGVQDVFYNGLGLPSRICVNGCSAGSVVEFDYDVTGARVREVASNKTVTSLGKLFERVVLPNGDAEHRYRLFAPHREVAQVSKLVQNGAITSRRTTYLHVDGLGSTQVLTGEDGSVVHEQSFDAFGEPSSSPVGGSTGVEVGFTGHGHDDLVGLVDMGHRLYDSRIGKFLAPDPIIAAPFWSQGLNAYSYVYNNPVNLTDPFGLQAEPPPGTGVWVCGNPNKPRCWEEAPPPPPPPPPPPQSPSFRVDTQDFGRMSDAGKIRAILDDALSRFGSGAGCGVNQSCGRAFSSTWNSSNYVNRPGQWLQEYHAMLKENAFRADAVESVGWANDAVGTLAALPVAGVVGGVRALLGRAVAARGAATIDTAAVRFSQNSVKQTLSTGENINDMVAALRGPGGDALAAGFKPIRIFEGPGGQLMTLDNRRLLIFSQAGREVPFVWAGPAEVAAQSWKFTATAEQASGWFIRVK